MEADWTTCTLSNETWIIGKGPKLFRLSNVKCFSVEPLRGFTNKYIAVANMNDGTDIQIDEERDSEEDAFDVINNLFPDD